MTLWLCRLVDIPDGEGTGFSLSREEAEEVSGGHPEIFVVRRGDRVFGYANICPHLLSPLDWVEGQFMSPDKERIMCATHGAQFRIEDGHCVSGPCEGDSLISLRISVQKDAIVLDNLAVSAPQAKAKR